MPAVFTLKNLVAGWLVVMLGIATCGLALAACKDPPAPGVDWHGCDLSGKELKGVDLSRANLLGGNLSNADLSGAFLVETNLTGASMHWTNLSGADLFAARLERAIAEVVKPICKLLAGDGGVVRPKVPAGNQLAEPVELIEPVGGTGVTRPAEVLRALTR